MSIFGCGVLGNTRPRKKKATKTRITPLPTTTVALTRGFTLERPGQPAGKLSHILGTRGTLNRSIENYFLNPIFLEAFCMFQAYKNVVPIFETNVRPFGFDFFLGWFRSKFYLTELNHLVKKNGLV